MEPLSKERSDDLDLGLGGVGIDAAMEPLSKERSDDAGDRARHRPRPAAMEPLSKERSDGHCRPVARSHVETPQWSRSRKSGVTSSSSVPGQCPRCSRNGAALERAE